MAGQNLNMPSSGYKSHKIFGLGQTPAAVVVGYGYWDGSNNRPQVFTLQVVELSSGTILMSPSVEVFVGKAAIINLPIRKSGNYEMKLMSDKSVYDTWNFSVNRESSTADSGNSEKSPVYAKGLFSASIDASCLNDTFTQYDESLMQDLLAAGTKEQEKSSADIFAQVAPGQVSIQFTLTANGAIQSPKITDSTLNEALQQFVLRALTNGSPYRPWPAAARNANGADTRPMKVAFYLD